MGRNARNLWSIAKSSNPHDLTTIRPPKEVHTTHGIPVASWYAVLSNHHEPHELNDMIFSSNSEQSSRFMPVNNHKLGCQQGKSVHKDNISMGKYKITTCKKHHDSAINSNHRNQRAYTMDSTHTIPALVNGLTSVDASTKNVCHKPKRSFQQIKEHKIIIIGDSHARGSASNVKHNLNDNYRSSGFVRPGANIDTLASSMPEDIKHLTNNGTIVFWGGTNDVGKNNSQDGLKHINFVKMNSHTNIILMSVPHRHDLSEWSCVNSEVKAFNRMLVKLMKPYRHAILVKVHLNRKLFTRQGLHMNNLGKKE
jgi:hypothetical protein